MPSTILKVPPLKELVRLDKFLVKYFPHTNRSYWREHLHGFIRVNGRKASKGQMLRGEETLELVKAPPSRHPKIIPDPKRSLKILYQDRDLIALDKPAGIPCHPLEPGETQTLANAMVAKFPELADFKTKPLEAGLIHRLDNETSGVLLFARHKKSYDALRKLNRAGGIAKFYLAWVEGLPPRNGKIDLPIAHHPKNKAKMLAVEDPKKARKWKARSAHTEFQIIKGRGTAPVRRSFSEGGCRAPTQTLLSVRIHKGARHQIRIHLAAIGHPIVGDKLYGNPKGYRRHFLHAHRVEFQHPFTAKKTTIVSPIPKDFLIYPPPRRGRARERVTEVAHE